MQDSGVTGSGVCRPATLRPAVLDRDVKDHEEPQDRGDHSHSQTLASYYIGLVKLLMCCMLTGLCIMPSEYYETTDALQKALSTHEE